MGSSGSALAWYCTGRTTATRSAAECTVRRGPSGAEFTEAPNALDANNMVGKSFDPVVDLTTPPGGVWPGKIADADFFNEQWQLKKK